MKQIKKDQIRKTKRIKSKVKNNYRSLSQKIKENKIKKSRNKIKRKRKIVKMISKTKRRKIK